MRERAPKHTGGTQLRLGVLGHAIALAANGALGRAKQVMGDKTERCGVGWWPGQIKPAARHVPGLEIGKVRGQRSQRVRRYRRAHQITQRRDIGGRQVTGEAFSGVSRQDLG
ncbi:MAG: hypothetical protein AcusKO_43140 [Acuticoccus sp.]